MYSIICMISVYLINFFLTLNSVFVLVSLLKLLYLSILHSWHTSLDSNNSVCSVFFDLTKAFDSVPHKPLLDCLSAIDLPSALLIWLNNYLFDRSQQVVVNGSTSSSKSHISSGVPQGSILGSRPPVYYLH